MTRRLQAWINLAWHFWKHVLTRLPLRPFRHGRDLARLLEQVRPEGFEPINVAERENFPAFMNCIHCGLCTLACPALREHPDSAWAEPWTFVTGPARSLHRAPLAAASVAPCARCAECAAVCPTGVPIPLLAALVTRLAESADGRAA
jgi:succinate dehydrogenase/fumarate reductase-like Fe-S protein